MQLIRGVEILNYRTHVDDRGKLAAFDEFDNIPFPPRRVFFLKVDDPDRTRGGHANSCDEFIMPLSGSVLVEVDNGRECCSVHLDTRDRALWIKSGIVINLREFESNTVLLICASASYRDTRHFDHPQPHLFMADDFV
ncbi:sugar 3,4-ketoisomerase [Methylobacterium dankookense]|uniref:TDP-4-oxo-6-deoxy-alpha-D-glucose-3, 4-oxoisomerase n=1 Tax=Methylobacterium dankookense TaxID=560405 RepID=A0A564G105_9HYPH|nr:FdtA/QdtA family cupin domain-containing protein [Methylobacterium dankookense]GJD55855.1 TDP-4-oxo-6-deoxy-alpha-D-glucose-3, 4-oxoisomerase [Methylobacterium dankookense]VUF14139.1 TDP-4-oxo-6-deoxy-alpha-D-glucose-3, 4-oxoisomerase [Methylobacterium dankookense]